VEAVIPDVSVVVASHERRERLGVLLDALAAQSLPRERWELVLAHTYDDTGFIDDHPLARDGVLRQVRAEQRPAPPAVQRNAGWRAARGRLIAFTDDDCRPELDWLARMLEAHSDGAIVQGATKPDPKDDDAAGALHIRTLEVDPPGRFTQTCNILYERATLERLGGFDERAIVGEDIDLARRAQSSGDRLVGAPGAVVYHAVEALSLGEKISSNRKWEHLAYVVKHHPEIRRELPMGIWWTPRHALAALALLGIVGATRRPALALAILPYYLVEHDHFGPTPKGRLRVLRRLHEFWLIELAEIAFMARGSLRYRTLLL
jgi:GT2 family glycosyltransferase